MSKFLSVLLFILFVVISTEVAYYFVFIKKNQNQSVQQQNINKSLSVISNKNYQIVRFIGWETIVNSTDRYILIDDPVSGKKLLRNRVVFSSINWMGASIRSNLAVEAVDQNTKEHNLESLSGFGAINNYTLQLNRLLKKDDIIVLRYQLYNNEIIKDADGFPVVWWLVVRRKEGKTAIEKELNL